MPIYEYHCSNCKQRFELKQGFKDEAIAVCPVCKSNARRLFSPVPIVFKGSGLYITDSRNKKATTKEQD